MKRRSILKAPTNSVIESSDSNVKKGIGKFTFDNGDTYEGEYKYNCERRILVKQGHGVYRTDDFNVYDGKWDNEQFADGEICISYNNGAQYIGEIDANGSMYGQGMYTFPDGSTIRATWLENKPFVNIVFLEPRGFVWYTESSSDNMISFSPGNHFWDEMNEEMSNEYLEKPDESLEFNDLN